MNFWQKQKRNIFILSGSMLVIFAVFCGIYKVVATENTNIDSVSKYAWSENGGWLNLRSDGTEVNVFDNKLTGYVWSENLGWISLNCENNDSCATVEYGVANDGGGNLSGYAWGENIGWVNFAPTNGGVSIDADGIFSGYAWGENIGWMVFDCSDLDACDTSSFKVKTNWRVAVAESVDDNSDEEISRLDVSSVKYYATDSKLIITWKTNRNADSRVRWGTDKNLSEDRKDDENVKKHRIVLENLQPNTAYYFRVKSVDGNDKDDSSEIHSVTTKQKISLFSSRNPQPSNIDSEYEKVNIEVRDKTESEKQNENQAEKQEMQAVGLKEEAPIEFDTEREQKTSLLAGFFSAIKNGTISLFSTIYDTTLWGQRKIAGFFGSTGEKIAGLYNNIAIKFNKQKATEVARINQAKFYTTQIFKRNDTKILADVRFQILDKSENPISNLDTMLFSDPQSSVTDENGIASFKDVPVGSHTLAFEYDNQNFQKKVAIADTMTDEGTVRAEIVEVRAEKEKVTMWMWTVIGLLLVMFGAAGYFAKKYYALKNGIVMGGNIDDGSLEKSVEEKMQ